MKYLLFLSLIIPTAFAREVVRQVDEIEYQDNVAHVQLEGGENLTIERDHPAMPCLWNGWMAPQEVLIRVNDETNEITECKLYASGVPNLENTRKRDY